MKVVRWIDTGSGHPNNAAMVFHKQKQASTDIDSKVESQSMDIFEMRWRTKTIQRSGGSERTYECLLLEYFDCHRYNSRLN